MTPIDRRQLEILIRYLKFGETKAQSIKFGEGSGKKPRPRKKNVAKT